MAASEDPTMEAQFRHNPYQQQPTQPILCPEHEIPVCVEVDEAASDEAIRYIVTVEHRHRRHSVCVSPAAYAEGTYVVLEMVDFGEICHDMGIVVACEATDRESVQGVKGVGHVLRAGSDEDMELYTTVNRQLEDHALAFVQQRAAALGIRLKVHSAEYQFDLKKLRLNYAPTRERVNFKPLVAEAYKQFRCRIWFNDKRHHELSVPEEYLLSLLRGSQTSQAASDELPPSLSGTALKVEVGSCALSTASVSSLSRVPSETSSGRGVSDSLVVVRHKHGRLATYCAAGAWERGAHVIVSVEGGYDLGLVITSSPPSTGTGNSGRVLRLASEGELRKYHSKLVKDEAKALRYMRTQARTLRLRGEIHTAEFQFDKKKLYINYTADKHCDFRELIKAAYCVFRCRIWMNNQSLGRKGDPVDRANEDDACSRCSSVYDL